MRMRATFDAIIDVADFVEAGQHEQFLKEVRATLERRFGEVSYRFHECRNRGTGDAAAARPPLSRTGRLKHYDS
ncbi:MAG TPA: hypothetical protein VEB20_21705 [Azospirillaceae bacterium]|nr:hypothetical protein [Azospirillaceae bacterium]